MELLESELEELQHLDQLSAPPDIGRVNVRVVESALSNFELSLDIDKGSDDGIAIGMPVVTGNGLVGRVSQVTPSTARVTPIITRGFAVGIRMVRSGDLGVAEGQGSGKSLLIDLVELDSPITPGESVLTAGLQGSPFPEGLVVGTVAGVDARPVEGRQLVLVDPSADLERLRFAAVLLFLPGDQFETGIVPPPGVEFEPVTEEPSPEEQDGDGEESNAETPER